MSYFHGVKTSEKATSIQPPIQTSAGIPFFIGTAPKVKNESGEATFNIPKLIRTFDQAVEEFGYAAPETINANDKIKEFRFTICEFMKSHFDLYGVSPVVIVNVLQDTDATTVTTTNPIAIDANRLIKLPVKGALIDDSLSITPTTSGASAINYTSERFTASYDDEGNLILGVISASDADLTIGTNVNISYKLLSTGNASGRISDAINKVDEVFQRYGLVPGILLAPGFSSNSTIATELATKAEELSEFFNGGCALIDAPIGTIEGVDYSDLDNIPTWKNNNSIVNKRQIVCWPQLELDGVRYHYSTQLAGLLQKSDANNEDIPYTGPSNLNLVCNGLLVEKTENSVTSKKEFFFSANKTQNHLNANGILTAINFIGGWKAWGTTTAAYPSITDPKDSSIPVMRMFSWIANQLVINFWSQLDAPTNRRQIDTILDSANIWLNSLEARQFILGGRVEFVEEENSTADLMLGKTKFHVYVTPPSPNSEIDFVLEYDVNYLSTLFA